LIHPLQDLSAPFGGPTVVEAGVGPNLGAVQEKDIAVDKAALQAEPDALFQNVFEQRRVPPTKRGNRLVIGF